MLSPLLSHWRSVIRLWTILYFHTLH
jgi:hypothetical protein